MSLKIKKDELELMSNKEIAIAILENSKRAKTTADIFKKLIKLKELPETTFENKIGDFYTLLSTSKEFILLEDGKWDLRVNHKSDKIKPLEEDEDEDDEEDIIIEDELPEEDSYDDNDDEMFVEDTTNEDLKDLIIIEDDEELDN